MGSYRLSGRSEIIETLQSEGYLYTASEILEEIRIQNEMKKETEETAKRGPRVVGPRIPALWVLSFQPAVAMTIYKVRFEEQKQMIQ